MQAKPLFIYLHLLAFLRSCFITKFTARFTILYYVFNCLCTILNVLNLMTHFGIRYYPTTICFFKVNNEAMREVCSKLTRTTPERPINAVLVFLIFT